MALLRVSLTANEIRHVFISFFAVRIFFCEMPVGAFPAFSDLPRLSFSG